MVNQARVHTRDEILIACFSVDRWSQAKWDANNPRACLRSLEFAPDSFSDDHYYMVNDVMTARKYALVSLKLFSSSPQLPRGRLLVYEPSLNLSDCMAEGQTNGLFDSNDCPPWDLWAGWVREADSNYLLSWIPDYLEKLTQDAIEVTCGGSLCWLDELGEPWTKAFP